MDYIISNAYVGKQGALVYEYREAACVLKENTNARAVNGHSGCYIFHDNKRGLLLQSRRVIYLENVHM